MKRSAAPGPSRRIRGAPDRAAGPAAILGVFDQVLAAGPGAIGTGTKTVEVSTVHRLVTTPHLSRAGAQGVLRAVSVGRKVLPSIRA